MSAHMKRHHELENIPDEKAKKPKKNFDLIRNNDDQRLHTFLKWCDENSFNLTNKVTVQKKGSCAQYGMIALEEIAEGYCLFQVPRSCLLTPENTNIARLIDGDAAKLDVKNKWIPLLLSLIHEHNDSASKWRPYLDLVPDYDELDLPLFWKRSSIENLITNSRVDDAVERDQKMIQSDFENVIVPFFQRHEKIRADLKDLEHFKKMVAFVMSYSFTEPMELEKTGDGDKGTTDNNEDESSDDEEEEEVMSPPMMVPMADMLNHITKHNAKLTFGKEALKMVTIRKISKVEIPVTRILESSTEINGDTSAFLTEKWKFLFDQDVLSDDEVFVLNKDGIITDDICIQALKVLCMTKTEFAEYQEKEGWSDAESDSSLSGESRLSFEKIRTLDKRWILLLKRMAEIHLDKYKTTLNNDEEKLKELQTLPKREKYSLFLVHGQKMLLHELIDVCNSCVKF